VLAFSKIFFIILVYIFSQKIKFPSKSEKRSLKLMRRTFNPLPKPEQKDTMIAKALLRGDTWETIQRDLHCGTRRISNVNQSIKTTGIPPQPKQLGRPSKITAALTLAVQEITTSDPRMGAR
jgi:hypothetical protein